MRRTTKKRLSIILSMMLVLSLLGTVSPANPAKEARAAGYGLSNPRVTGYDETTWDCVYFGNYWQEDTNGDGKTDKNDKKTPVKWRVLSIDGDDVFLMADKNLDCQRYNDKDMDVTWETCTMRSWLNGYGEESNKDGKDYSGNNFLDNAFSPEEQSAIKTTNVVNNDNPENGTEGGNDTEDKVYLLSLDEVTNPAYGFASHDSISATRVAVNTAYTAGGGEIENGYMNGAGNEDYWWLRSPGYGSSRASNVLDRGDLHANGNYVDDYVSAVRPALHLNLSSSKWSKAGTVSSSAAGSVEATPTPVSSAPAAKSYDFLTAYSSEDNKTAYTGEIQVQFNENELRNSSKEYNHSLATFCSVLSTLAYDVKDGYEKMLSKMDYEQDSMVLDKEGDSICYGLANKTILLDGKETDVVLVVLRGTYNMEWIDNFDPGTGKTHKGFKKGADTAYEALKKYITKKEIGEDGREVKIIVTGHSRGAAVANLLGKEILDKGGSFLKEAGNLFDYSFATPNSTSLEERTSEKYDGIFSIVNPEDFVTKVMLSKNWNYGRYGRTLVLPSRSTDSAAWYKKFLSEMRGNFKKYRPYDGYEPYPKGMNEVSDYVNLVAQTVPSVNRYYYQSLANPWDVSYIMKTSNTLKKLYTDFMGYKQCNNSVYEMVSYATVLAAVAGDYGFLGQSTAAYFIENQAIDSRFEWAHLSETYLASMKALEAEDLYKNGKPVKRTVKHGIVNCPVDVSITNGEGEVVGKIVDNRVVTDIEGDSVNLSVTGDSKQFWISADEDCHVILTGNDNGTMDYVLSEDDADSGETQRILYKTVPLENDKVYTSELLCDEGIAEAELKNAAGDVIDKSEELSDEKLGNLSVTVKIEGVGMADSFNGLSYGDSVVLTAIPDANNSFLGWYDSENNLVSTESKYPVIVTENQNYTAKFTNIIVSPTEINTAQKLAMSTGEIRYLEAVLLPENVTCPDVIYESGDESIVSVSEDGILEAKSKGIVEITVKSQMDNTIQSICKVAVDLSEENPDTPTATPTLTATPTSTATPTPTIPSTITPTATPTVTPDIKEDVTPSAKPSASPTEAGKSDGTGIQPVTSSPAADGENKSTVSPETGGKAPITPPAKVKLKKIRNKKGRKLSLSWNKVKGAKSYQLQYAGNKKFKKKKSRLTKKTKYTIKKLKKKKTYYIRVRAYKVNSAKKVYGRWSKVKKIKVKR